VSERHAELPWKFSPWHIEEGPSAVRCATGYLVCETAGDADAKLIVAAVNSHDALVKALKTIIDANHAFLNSLPEDWEGDPLQDACFEAAKLLRDLVSTPRGE
jgi:hypothetical protein